MDLEFSPEDLRFQNEVRDFLADSLPAHVREAAARTATVFVDKDLALEWQRILVERGWAVPSWTPTPAPRTARAASCGTTAWAVCSASTTAPRPDPAPDNPVHAAPLGLERGGLVGSRRLALVLGSIFMRFAPRKSKNFRSADEWDSTGHRSGASPAASRTSTSLSAVAINSV